MRGKSYSSASRKKKHDNTAVSTSQKNKPRKKKKPETSTTMSWLPTTSSDPYIRLNLAGKKRELIKKELCVSAGDDGDDKSFVRHEKHIPNDPIAFPALASSALTSNSRFVGHYHSNIPFAKEFVNMKLGTNGDLNDFKASSGWNDWPSPETAGFNEHVVGVAFVKFLNTIIAKLGLSQSRVAVDRQKFPIKTRDGGFLYPDAFVWGSGTAFPPMNNKPPTKTRRKPNNKRAHDAPPDASDEMPPLVEWPWCLLPIEVKTEKNANSQNDTYQLGTYVNEVLTAQPNRLFVPSLIVTEIQFQFLFWDRAGVVLSERVNYHEHFELFCSMLCNFMVWEPEKMGFDPTIFYSAVSSHDPPLATIRTEECDAAGVFTGKTVEYIVEEVLLRPYTILGRGSTCSRGYRIGDRLTRYLILDSWVEGGCQTEKEIYQKMHSAQVEGLGDVVAIYDVPMSMIHHVTNIDHVAGPYPTDTKHIRGGSQFLKNSLNLVHTRTVLRCDVVPLGHWSTPRELLITMYDAISAHKNLYLEARILHRDVVPWNIFIVRKPGGKNLRGVLVDFTRATLVNAPTTPTGNKVPICMWFSSHKMLITLSHSSFLDDLESFYWILYSTVSVGMKPDLDKTVDSLSEDMDALVATGVAKNVKRTAGRLKSNHIFAPLEVERNAAFPEPVFILLKDLHDCCAEYWGHISARRFVDPEKCYREFLGHFALAIKKIPQLEGEEPHMVDEEGDADRTNNQV